MKIKINNATVSFGAFFYCIICTLAAYVTEMHAFTIIAVVAFIIGAYEAFVEPPFTSDDKETLW